MNTTSTAPTANGKPHASPDPAASAGAPVSGAQIILEYLREKYRPVFRAGTSIHTVDGETIPMAVGTALPGSVLIERLKSASNVPRFAGGGLKESGLPGFFKAWAKTAWSDLLDELPDEDAAALGADSPAAETFRRLVRDAMLSELVLGDTIEKLGVTQTERRSLIDWCVKFAKPGPWRSIRSKKCWCRIREREGGEIQLQVAIRVELFAQLRADRRLCEMNQNTFARRAERYGVGTSSRDERPEGNSAVVLCHEFIAELTDCSLPTESEPDESPDR